MHPGVAPFMAPGVTIVDVPTKTIGDQLRKVGFSVHCCRSKTEGPQAFEGVPDRSMSTSTLGPIGDLASFVCLRASVPASRIRGWGSLRARITSAPKLATVLSFMTPAQETAPA